MEKKPKKITTVRIAEDTLEQFDACAAKRGISRNLLLQQLMDKFIREDRRRTVEGIV
jgi:predicted DNA binding CopG/RHH family protein